MQGESGRERGREGDRESTRSRGRSRGRGRGRKTGKNMESLRSTDKLYQKMGAKGSKACEPCTSKNMLEMSYCKLHLPKTPPSTWFLDFRETWVVITIRVIVIIIIIIIIIIIRLVIVEIHFVNRQGGHFEECTAPSQQALRLP